MQDRKMIEHHIWTLKMCQIHVLPQPDNLGKKESHSLADGTTCLLSPFLGTFGDFWEKF